MSIGSVLKLRPVPRADHQQTVEKVFAEIPPVELVAELVEIFLEVFPLDAVVGVEQERLCVRQSGMHPR